MNTLRPTRALKSMQSITPDVVHEVLPAAQGITFDLDKTLVGQEDMEFAGDVLESLHMLRAAGLEIGLVSNARSEFRSGRVKLLASEIGSYCVAVPLSDIDGKAKPDPALFIETARRLNIPPKQLIHVGDQLFKDILGANRAGYGATVLVAPYGEGDHPGVKYLQRPVEALLRPFMGLPIRSGSFPTL